jgi:hypothetical protein
MALVEAALGEIVGSRRHNEGWRSRSESRKRLHMTKHRPREPGTGNESKRHSRGTSQGASLVHASRVAHASPRAAWTAPAMSHHLFLLSPSDTPLYSLTHYSAKPTGASASALSANLPTWSTSAFAGTLTALSGAASAPQPSAQGAVRIGAGQDRHVIQMIANASLDVVEEVMRKDSAMCAGLRACVRAAG